MLDYLVRDPRFKLWPEQKFDRDFYSMCTAGVGAKE